MGRFKVGDYYADMYHHFPSTFYCITDFWENRCICDIRGKILFSFVQVIILFFQLLSTNTHQLMAKLCSTDIVIYIDPDPVCGIFLCLPPRLACSFLWDIVSHSFLISDRHLHFDKHSWRVL